MSFQRCGVCGVIADGKLCSGCELIEKDVRESGAFIAQLELWDRNPSRPREPRGNQHRCRYVESGTSSHF